MLTNEQISNHVICALVEARHLALELAMAQAEIADLKAKLADSLALTERALNAAKECL